MRTIKATAAAATQDTTKLHAFEWAWLDSSEGLPISVYSNPSTPRGSRLDSIPSGRLDYPLAHAFFGDNESPRIYSITFANREVDDAIYYEARVYPAAMDSVRYDDQYSILATAFIDSSEAPVTFDFGSSGRYMAPGTYLAIMAKGLAVNSHGAVTIVGQRRR
jgi:hypothetical protein